MEIVNTKVKKFTLAKMDTCTTTNNVYLYLGSDAPTNSCIIPNVHAIEIISADIEHPSLVSYSGSVTLAWSSDNNTSMNTYSFVPQMNSLETMFNDITISSAPVKITPIGNTDTNYWTITIDTTLQDLSNFFGRVLHIPSTITGSIMPGTYTGYTSINTTVKNPPNGYWLPPPSRGIGVVLQLGGYTLSTFEGTTFQGCVYVDTPNMDKDAFSRIYISTRNNGKPITIRGISGYLQYANKYPCTSDWSLIICCIRE